MLTAIFSDVHANLEAFEAVFDEALARGASRFWCLGDTVGYGGDPGPCVDLARRWCPVSILGNHDDAVVTGDGLEVLPKPAQEAALNHRERLSAEQLAWLRDLPLLRIEGGVTLVHATPDDPKSWARLDGVGPMRELFEHFSTSICLVGHSHRPSVASDTLGVFKVRLGHRYLIDVGSVGQPRDKDPRASFGLLNPEAMTYENIRVHYDVERAAEKIRKAGLPESMASRLERGE